MNKLRLLYLFFFKFNINFTDLNGTRLDVKTNENLGSDMKKLSLDILSDQIDEADINSFEYLFKKLPDYRDRLKSMNEKMNQGNHENYSIERLKLAEEVLTFYCLYGEVY